MTIGGTSFQGQANAQANRLRDLQQAVQDLQRQATTQKKHERFSGFGFESLSVQRYRMDLGRLDSYLGNITTASTRIKTMTNSLDFTSKSARELLGAFDTEVLGGEIDVGTIRTIAQNGLAFLQNLVNTELDGRFLFAGSSTQTQPFINDSQLQTTAQTAITDWLNGTQTTAQLIAASEALTTSDLGFDPALSAAGDVSLRIDQTTEVNYTVIGNSNGFEDLMRGFALAANLEIPDELTDVPDLNQFTEVVRYIADTVRRGVDAIDSANARLGSTFTLISSVEESHRQQKALIGGLSDQTENVDTTEVVAKLQILQTQLEASYQITGIVSQLSLVNFLPI